MQYLAAFYLRKLDPKFDAPISIF